MDLFEGLTIPPELILTAICVILGAIVLTRFTWMSGVAGYLINTLALTVGAELALLLTADLDLPFDYVVQRTLVVTFAGMLVAAVVMLFISAATRQD